MSQVYATGASRQDEDLRRRIPDHQANGNFKFPADEKDDKKAAKVRFDTVRPPPPAVYVIPKQTILTIR